jgi:hypothetical protein
MAIQRRNLLLMVLGGTAALTAGCGTRPLQRANADGTYCYRPGKSYSRTRTCTASPIPSEQTEAAAKRFEAASGRLTVYLVRNRWADSKGIVEVASETGSSVDTVPASFVRWQFPPGNHTLKATWSNGTRSLDISGMAGDIVYVELVGAAWSWGSKYRLERGEAAESRQRAASLRMVADIG